jgi:N-carbamoyl-L-amino-acid hydrolase
MVDYLSSICEDEEVSYKRMPSGAGHDTMFWAPYAPAGMLFIPCKDGISHNAAEHAEMDDIFCVTKLLEKAVKKLSQENFKI